MTDSLIDTVLGQYHLRRELGRGGMGEVYLAHEQGLERLVAVKVLPDVYASRPDALQRFYREARAAASINHPNVVTIHNVGEESGRHFIAMEYIDGPTVEALLRGTRPINLRWVLGITRQVLKGLAEAHRLKIVHRDIKPHNIMIDRTGRVKVLDFGIARVLSESGTGTEEGQVPGTPSYMSPEQVNGQRLDGRSDIFSLGVVMYRMVAGELPFRGANRNATMRRIVEDTAPPLLRFNPDTPREIVDLINRAMLKNPDGRFQTALEMLAAVERIISGEKERGLPDDQNPYLKPLPMMRPPAAVGATSDSVSPFVPAGRPAPTIERIEGQAAQAAGSNPGSDPSAPDIARPQSNSAEKPSPALAVGPEPPLPDTMICRACKAANALPYLFCESCGAPRVEFGRWRIFTNCTLALLAFLGLHLMKADPDFSSGLSLMNALFTWDWPVFLLYAFFFWQFMLALTAGAWRLSLRTSAWFGGFVLAALAVIETVQRAGAGFLLELINSIPQIAREFPLQFFGGLGGLMLIVLLPCFVRWGRKFGWTMAYRLVILSVSAGCFALLGAGHLLTLLARAGWIEDAGALLRAFDSQARPDFEAVLWPTGVRLLTLLVIELFVYASIRGYAAGRGRRIVARREALADQGGFGRGLIMLAQIVRQMGSTAEQMTLHLLATLRELGRDLALVFRAFLREVFFPTLAMAAACALLLMLTEATSAYLAESSLLALPQLLGGMVAIVAAAVVFLGCKTRLRWSSIAAFYAQFIGWIIPNLVVFFMLISLSLFASTFALEHTPLLQTEVNPYRPGMVTGTMGALLLILVVVVLVRKRAVFSEVTIETEPAAATAAGTATAGAARSKEDSDTNSGSIARGLGRVMAAADEARERLKGKPAIVTKLADLRQKHDEKQAQLRSLENVRASVSPATYNEMTQRTRGEIEDLALEIARVQASIEEQLTRKQREREELAARLAMLNARREELTQLAQAGALDDGGYKIGLKQNKAESEKLKIQLESVEALIGFLKT